MSYHGLTVALNCGAWSCELVPAAEYRSPTGVRLRLITGDEQKALENDRRTFARYFRPGYDFRRTIATDIDAIRSFVRDHLNVAHWNQPTDNAGIERFLKHAVADGRLVPVIDRVVRFDLDFESWPNGGESVPLRLAKPFAGNGQTGMHFPALDGDEAVISFRDADPD